MPEFRLEKTRATLLEGYQFGDGRPRNLVMQAMADGSVRHFHTWFLNEPHGAVCDCGARLTDAELVERYRRYGLWTEA